MTLKNVIKFSFTILVMDQVRDLNGDEISGFDSVLVPMDFQSSGIIVDDILFS
jgi:hypothetical protein